MTICTALCITVSCLHLCLASSCVALLGVTIHLSCIKASLLRDPGVASCQASHCTDLKASTEKNVLRRTFSRLGAGHAQWLKEASKLLSNPLSRAVMAPCCLPKNYNAEAVFGLGARLLSDAGISPLADRSSTEIVIHEDLTSLLPAPSKFPGRGVTAGMVWMPRREIKLFAEAGAALQGFFLKPRMPFHGFEDDATRIPLEEVGGLVTQRLVNDVGNFRDHARAEDPEFLLASVPDATLRCTEMAASCQLPADVLTA